MADLEAGPAHPYLGHLAGNSHRLVLVTADDFLDCLDSCDLVGQPDEGSFQVLRDPMVLRFKAQLIAGKDEDGIPFERVVLTPFAVGFMALAGRDLVRMAERARTDASTITDDVLRTLGSKCERCGFNHNDWQDCRAFVEPGNRLGFYLGYVDLDPTQVVVVAAPHDEDYARAKAIAAVAGSEPKIIKEIPPEVLFQMTLLPEGSIQPDPERACYYEDSEWLESLRDLLVAEGEG